MLREEGRRKQAVDGQLGRAAHKGGEQDGHFAVALRGQGAAGHDAGDGAAEADEHWHDAPPREADAAEKLIHHECHAGHVSGILQQREEEEQGHDDGQEAQHTAHTGEDAVDDQRVDGCVDVPRREGGVCRGGQGINAHFQQVLECQTDDAEGEVEHQRHDAHKGRDGGIAAREEPVDPGRAELLLALAGLHDGLLHQLVDEVEPHIRDGGGAIQTPLLLHLDDDVLDHLFFVLVELQGRLDALVALHELCGRKAHRDACGLGMILDQVDDAVDAAVDCAAVILLAAEIHPARPLLILCDMERMIHQLVHALVLCRRDGHDRDAQHGLHLIDADSAAVAAHLVHHVQRQHHRRIQLHELHGEVQIPLDVGGVHDIDDARGLLADDELPGHDLLAGIGRHGVDAGQVCDLRIRVIPDRTALAVHRHTREIADVLVGAGELVEEGRLAAVLVARQRKGKGRAVGQRVLALFGVVASAFAEARVLHRLFTFCRRLFHRRGFGQSDPDAGGIVQPEGQLVAVDAQLHRVAHRGKFDQRDLLAGDQPHIQKMLPQSAFAAHGPDHGGLADVQIFQRHMECSSRARLLVCINNSNIG